MYVTAPYFAEKRILSPQRIKKDKYRKEEREKRTAFLYHSIGCRHFSIFPGRRQPSIFDADELNFRVRYGNGWSLIAINTDFTEGNQLD